MQFAEYLGKGPAFILCRTRLSHLEIYACRLYVTQRGVPQRVYSESYRH